VVYTLFDILSVSSSAIRILQSYFVTILQENIDTVTVGRVENVGEEDCVKIKTEEDYVQLAHTVKTEEEVSVVCWCVLW
jgi:hypothetical protein